MPIEELFAEEKLFAKDDKIETELRKITML